MEHASNKIQYKEKQLFLKTNLIDQSVESEHVHYSCTNQTMYSNEERMSHS